MEQKLQNYLEALKKLTVDCRVAGTSDQMIAGATCDSRMVAPGWIFCAVQGSLQDGHQFIPQALARGASAIVAERAVEVPSGITLIQVSDGYRALGLAAECMHGAPAKKLKNLAVTGTNGKTTCAFLLRELLQKCGRRCGMIGTVEYDLGGGDVRSADRTTPTPFELQGYLDCMVRNRTEYDIIEVSSHALAQGRLAGMKFAGAIFTNLTQDHLDYHKTMEAYYQCKRGLFTDMMINGEAPVIVNGDDAWGQRLIGELPAPPAYVIRKGTSGEKAGGGQCLLLIGEQGKSSSCFTLRFAEEDWSFETPMAGEYNFYNLASVICLVRALGMGYEDIAGTVKNSHGAPGRLQICPGTGDFRIYVDYAHTDDAIAKALLALRPLCGHRLSIVFGCGGNRDRTKRPKMAAAAARYADRLYITSDNPRREVPGKIIEDILTGLPAGIDYCVEEDRRAAIARALGEAEPGDILLIAGKGHESYQEIQGVKYPFSDFQCVKEVLKQ